MQSIEKMKITLRRGDWWFWENSAQLGINPSVVARLLRLWKQTSVPKMKARYLIAIAESDDQRQPEAKTVLREAFAKAKLPAEIEVYPGTIHGWCPIDARVYNREQAEKAWSRMLALFGTALA